MKTLCVVIVLFISSLAFGQCAPYCLQPQIPYIPQPMPLPVYTLPLPPAMTPPLMPPPPTFAPPPFVNRSSGYAPLPSPPLLCVGTIVNGIVLTQCH